MWHERQNLKTKFMHESLDRESWTNATLISSLELNVGEKRGYVDKKVNHRLFGGEQMYFSHLQKQSPEKVRPATLFKKRPWHRCFPVNFAKCLRTSSLHNNTGRLLLTLSRDTASHSLIKFSVSYLIRHLLKVIIKYYYHRTIYFAKWLFIKISP